MSSTRVGCLLSEQGQPIADHAVIDYKKQAVKEAIPAGSVDFFFDTTGQAMEFLSLITPKTGLVISISTTPSGTTMRDAPVLANGSAKPQIPFIVFHALNAIDAVRKFRAKRWGAGYDYIFLNASAKDLNELREHVEAGKLKTIVGQTTDLKDIEAVKKVAMDSYQGKTGLGKIVINVRKD